MQNFEVNSAFALERKTLIMKTIRKTVAVLFFTWLTAMAMTGLVRADERYIIGIEGLDYYPHYQFKGGKLTGFACDILDRFAKDKGYIFEYKAMPVKRLPRSLRQGVVDFRYPDNPAWNNEDGQKDKLLYSLPLVGSHVGLAVNAGRRKGGEVRTIGVPLGFIPFEYIDALKAGEITIQYDNNFLLLIRQAVSGGIDAVYGDKAVIEYQLKNNRQQLERLKPVDERIIAWEDQRLTFDTTLPNTIQKFSLSTIRHKKVVAEFNQWLEENDMMVARIRNFYGLVGCPCTR